MLADATEPHPPQPSILSFVKDLPNLCSLAGLACSVFAIYFAILGVFSAAMIGVIWAVAFDWSDGLIARQMKGRTDNDRAFGGHLDSLIDVVSYGVAPAVILLSYAQFHPAYLIGAFLIVAVSVIRLSYFNTFGLASGSKYTGLALDNNSIILVFVFLFSGLFSTNAFAFLLLISSLGIAALNVCQIKTPKLSEKAINVYLLGLYTLGITVVYGWKLL